MVQPEQISVTTIIPAYQAGRFINRAIESALRQGIPNHEILVVDDASTDGTADIVRRYAAEDVRLIRHNTRRGVSVARNTGITGARGTYIAFLDADDEWLPGKLSQQLAVITAAPRMTFVTCHAMLIDEHGDDAGDIYKGARFAPGAEAWRALLRRPLVATPTVLARREALLAAGSFNPRLFVGEDQDMWIRLGLMGEVGVVPETLVRVYSTPHSLSKANVRAQQNIVVPMIRAYVARNQHRLTRHETHEILAARYAKAGHLAYGQGDVLYGLKHFLLAVRHGYPPVEALLFLVRASAAAGMAKHTVRQLLPGHLSQPRRYTLHRG